MAKKYNLDLKKTILEQYKQGTSARSLSEEYKVGYSTILKWVQLTKPNSFDSTTLEELRALNSELKRLEEENDILKKSIEKISQKTELYELVHNESEAGEHSVAKMCGILGLSRSKYYRKYSTGFSK